MNLQDHMDEVMDYIDFDTIEVAMEAVGHYWQDGNGEAYIPNKAQLRQKVRHMMSSVYHSEEYDRVCQCGFDVMYDREGDYFDVKFILDSWTTNL